MNIWNKVLLGLNILVAFGVFYFALKTLNIHRVWRESAQKHEKKLQEVEKENRILEQGPDGEGGIRELEIKLAAEYAGRGRVWYGCEPKPVEDLNEIKVYVTQPKPHSIKTGDVLYLFDCLPEEESAAASINTAYSKTNITPSIPKVKSARFLGEFVVTRDVDLGIVIKPNMPLTSGLKNRITKSANRISSNKKGFWMIWEQMPADSHRLFASKSEEELRELFPAEIVEEYLKNGGKDRKLHDYLAIFKWYSVMRGNQDATLNRLTRHEKILKDALDELERQQKISKLFNDDLYEKLDKIVNEKKDILDHEKFLQKEHDRLAAKVKDLMNKNQAQAQLLQQVEEEAIMQINSRTASSR